MTTNTISIKCTYEELFGIGMPAFYDLIAKHMGIIGTYPSYLIDPRKIRINTRVKTVVEGTDTDPSAEDVYFSVSPDVIQFPEESSPYKLSNGIYVSPAECYNIFSIQERAYHEEDIFKRIVELLGEGNALLIPDDIIGKITDNYEKRLSNTDGWAILADDAVEEYEDEMSEFLEEEASDTEETSQQEVN